MSTNKTIKVGLIVIVLVLLGLWVRSLKEKEIPNDNGVFDGPHLQVIDCDKEPKTCEVKEARKIEISPCIKDDKCS